MEDKIGCVPAEQEVPDLRDQQKQLLWPGLLGFLKKLKENQSCWFLQSKDLLCERFQYNKNGIRKC